MEGTLLKEAASRASDVAELTRRLGAQAEKQNRASRDLRLLVKQVYGIHKQQFQTIEEVTHKIRIFFGERGEGVLYCGVMPW